MRTSNRSIPLGVPISDSRRNLTAINRSCVMGPPCQLAPLSLSNECDAVSGGPRLEN
jgi:hypothetical protein